MAVTHTAHTPDVADAVEHAMLDRFAVSFLYKEKYRELAFNLRSNMTLRENVLCGAIAPVSLVRMSSSELRRGCPVEKRNEQEEKEEEEGGRRSLSLSPSVQSSSLRAPCASFALQGNAQAPKL